jgi:hypothetical protein
MFALERTLKNDGTPFDMRTSAVRAVPFPKLVVVTPEAFIGLLELSTRILDNI